MTGIFVITGDDNLSELPLTQYATEADLQLLIAKYPNLLPGDQIDEKNPVEWVLIDREIGVPVETGGTNRFSIDHVLVDQFGLPTLVEVKRRSDTRIRREVIGQMLEYAANVTSYVSAENLRQKHNARCESVGHSGDAELSRRVGGDPSDFWATVQRNLDAGRLRLLFVADDLPSELRRIIEYLNEQMQEVEVLGVEIKQYSGNGIQTLVPRVVGYSERVKEKRRNRSGSSMWSRERMLAEIERLGDEELDAALAIFEWVDARKDVPIRLSYGQGAVLGNVFPVVDANGDWNTLFSMQSTGKLEIQFGQMRTKPPFSDPERRLELLRHLNSVPGVAISEDRVDSYPSVPLAVIAPVMPTFIEVCDWWWHQLRATERA